MSSKALGFAARLALFFSLPWRLLFDGQLAARLSRAAQGLPEPITAPEPPPADTAPAPADAPLPPGPQADDAAPEGLVISETLASTEPEPIFQSADPTAALQLLAILQREGRFIDFLQEDVAHFEDAEIGAAARVVHEGCKRALSGHLDLAPVRSEPEGQTITLAPGYDALAHRVTGNVVGAPPFSGALAHPGWRVTRIELPRLSPGYDAHVVAPAEVEV